MIFIAFLLLDLIYGKIYERCELARELKSVHKAPSHQLATWVCIAEHESQYNTSVVGHLSGDGSGDHGIFQISDRYWCSPPNKGYACGLTCAELEDDDISDDFICAQRIYKEHKQLSGDGFNAWVVYQSYCKGPKANHYIKDCFNESEGPKTFANNTAVFAHGFFDTAAGKTNRGGFSINTQKMTLEPILNFRSPSTIQSQKFTITTKNPDLNSLSTSKPSFFTNRFFTATENSNSDPFFIPTSTRTFKPVISTTTTYIPKTTRPSENNIIITNPTTSTPDSASPTAVRTSFFESKKTFSTPSSEIFFIPTVSPQAYQTSTVSYPAPIFIFNGVKWY